MSEIQSLRIPELTEDELFFKQIFRMHPDAHLDQAKTIDEINRSVDALADHLSPDLPYAPKDTLHELYFPPDLDIVVLPSFRYAPAFLHTHSFFEVICVLNGQCENQFSSETLVLSAGDICIMAPGTTHAISVFDDNCLVYNLLIRSGTFEQSFLSSMPKDGVLFKFFANALHNPGEESCLFFKKNQDPALSELVLKMRREYLSQEQYYASLLNAFLVEFFITLLRDREQEILLPHAASQKQEVHLLQIMQYIEQSFTTITLKKLSAAFNYSERHMIRILKEYTGETFSSLVRSARLNRACELLRNSDMQIQQIIQEVGYANLTHFYHSFRSKYHMTPAEYREQFSAEGLFNIESRGQVP